MCSDSLDSFFTAHVHLLGLTSVHVLFSSVYPPKTQTAPLGQEASSSSKAIQKVSVLVEKTGEDYGH